MLQLICHEGMEKITGFVDAYVNKRKSVLFVGTYGFSDICLHFPAIFKEENNVEYLFFDEMRPEPSPTLTSLAENNKENLVHILKSRKITCEQIEIIADDMATVAGRNAVKIFESWLEKPYDTFIIDASAMSRGICFPIIKQTFIFSERNPGIDIHVVVAEKNSPLEVQSMSTDSPQYMHGFQADMESDGASNAVKLWLPQLSEKNRESLERIWERLKPHEVAPILPFPSVNPRRGDDLIREFYQPLVSDWGVDLLDTIYAHESDPNDVFETIRRIHRSRENALSSVESVVPRTVLSPTGHKIGSLGMAFAAIDLDLPIMYSESVGYSCEAAPTAPTQEKQHENPQWHIWIRSLNP